MTSDTGRDPAEADGDESSPDGDDGTAERRDPKATAHPTGDAQAAENAENEPAG